MILAVKSKKHADQYWFGRKIRIDGQPMRFVSKSKVGKRWHIELEPLKKGRLVGTLSPISFD